MRFSLAPLPFPRVNVIKLFSSYHTCGQNKLECFYLASLMFASRERAYQFVSYEDKL